MYNYLMIGIDSVTTTSINGDLSSELQQVAMVVHFGMHPVYSIASSNNFYK